MTSVNFPGLAARLALLALVVSALACSQESPDQLVARGTQLAGKGDHAGAMIHFKSALQQQADKGEARLGLGESMLATGQLEAAMVELAKAAEVPALAPRAVPVLAAALVEAGEYKRLVQQFGTRALGVPAADAGLQAELAKAYMGLGQVQRARDAVAAGLKLVPDHAESQLVGARMVAGGGNVPGAIELTERVLKQHPGNPRAWLLKGELADLALGDTKAASTAFRKAIELAPRCIECHAGLISMHLRKRDFKAAREQNETLRAVAPGHAHVALVDAYLALSDGELERARDRAQALLKVYPDHPVILSVAAAVELRMGLSGQAVAYLSKALNINPRLDNVRLQLAEAELQLGRPEGALQTLAPLLSGKTAQPEALAVSGSAHLKLGDIEAAERAFSRAASNQPDNLRLRTSAALARLGIGDTSTGIVELRSISERTNELFADEALLAAHLRRREYEAALAVVDRMTAKGAEPAQMAELKSRVEMMRGNLPAAQALLDKARSLNPALFVAVGGLTNLDVMQGRIPQALERLRDFTQKQPDQMLGWMALAALTARHTQEPLQVVKGLYEQAIKAAPNAKEPRLALVEYLWSKGRAKDALAVAQTAVAALPADPALLDMLGLAQLRAGEAEASMVTFRQLAGFLGESPQPYVRLAQAYVASNRRDQAEIALRKAIDLDPLFLPAQGALVDLLSTGNRSDEALKHVRRLRENRPSVPVGYALESIVLTRRGDLAGAAAVLRVGLEKAPDGDLAERLVSLHLQQSQLADAERVGLDRLKREPDDIGMEFLVSGVNIVQGKLKEAENRLRKVVARRPTHGMALNNLAAVIVKTGGSSAEALALARRAVDQSPDSAAFLDTLATALAADGQLPAAVTAQRSAVEKAAENHDLRLRLAELAVQAGDKAQAKSELDKLAQLGPKFARQAEVERLRRGL
jgi:cellulose synthase operon protein C